MISAALAELLGMHAGDGTLYRTTSGMVWELRGNLDEKEFYDLHVVPLIASLGFTLQGRERSGGKNGCYGVRCCKRAFHQLLLDAGFSPGKKAANVIVPARITEAGTACKAAFLRGLIATDGTAYMRGKHPYIELGVGSVALRDGAVQLLQDLGLIARIWTYNPRQRGGPIYFLRLSGVRKVRRFQEYVGLSNPKHHRRIARFL